MIYLREITREDMPIINGYRKDYELVKELGAPFRYVNPDTDYSWYDNYLKNRSSNVRCAICLEKNGQVIGTVYLLDIHWIYRRASLGIMIGDKQHQGKGYGKKAMELILNHAFRDLNLNRIEIKVVESNTSAIGFYEKLGFEEEGRLREAVYRDGTYQDQILMSLLKTDYNEEVFIDEE